MFNQKILVAAGVLILSGCTAFDYGYNQSLMTSAGWVDMSISTKSQEIAKKRIIEERNCSVAASIITQYGYPDFYRSVDLDDFLYLYLKHATIYQFGGSKYLECFVITYQDGRYPAGTPTWLISKLREQSKVYPIDSVFEKPPEV